MVFVLGVFSILALDFFFEDFEGVTSVLCSVFSR